MNNISTYLEYRSDITFKQSPFNEADAIILSMLIGLDYEGVLTGRMPIKEVYDKYRESAMTDEKDDRYHEKEEVFFACAESLRFGKIELENYVKLIDKEDEVTFYALTIHIGREAYVAFRGTDGSLLSWKENFRTLYEKPTRGQYEALKYLTKAASKPFTKVSVLGHSKGGNLVVYAAMSLDSKLQKKIKKVYAFDAPGFIDDISDNLGYLNIEDRIEAYVPESAVIGNLMRPPFNRKVVKGIGTGLFQHDMFNWITTADGLKLTEDTNAYSKDVSERANGWIESIKPEDRKRVVDELFSVFEKNGIDHIGDLIHMDLKKILSLIKCLTSLSSENRELLGIVIKQVRQSH